jgi:hypothetical protein
LCLLVICEKPDQSDHRTVNRLLRESSVSPQAAGAAGYRPVSSACSTRDVIICIIGIRLIDRRHARKDGLGATLGRLIMLEGILWPYFRLDKDHSFISDNAVLVGRDFVWDSITAGWRAVHVK